MMQAAVPHLIAALSFCGLLGCYDITRRMSIKTRHGIRSAVLVIGLACVAGMMGEHELALAGLLFGCGMYRCFDQRTEGYRHARGRPCDRGAVDIEPNRGGFSADELITTPGHALGGVVHLQAVRADHGVRRSA